MLIAVLNSKIRELKSDNENIKNNINRNLNNTSINRKDIELHEFHYKFQFE